MINEKIKNILNDIAPVFYQSTKNKKDKYIIFSIYDEQDSMIYDDVNMAEKYYITLTYWCKNPRDLILYKQIKEILKSNDFTFNGCSDEKDGDYNGKNMDFIYEEILER